MLFTVVLKAYASMSLLLYVWPLCQISVKNVYFYVNFYSIVKMLLHLAMHLLTAFASVWAVKVLMGNFNHPSICRRDSTVGHRQSWGSLECISFFLQVTEEQRRGAHCTSCSPAGRGTLGIWGSKAAVTVRWWTLGVLEGGGRVKKASSQPCTWGQQILAFPKGRVPWNKALEERAAQESWLIFKHHFLQAQEQTIPMRSKPGKISAWMNSELPDNLRD